MHVLIGVIASVFLATLTVAADEATDGVEIDVPVVLKDAKVVFNLDHAAFEGDEPTGLGYMRVMVDRFRADDTSSHIVAIFHGEAAYMVLNDAAYDHVRNWQNGNPYNEQIARLIREGVDIEICGHTMQVKGWRNANLLPDIKVNTGANFRVVELVQKGYVQIQP